MTTSTHKYGWNGESCPIKARKENDAFVRRVNRVLKLIGQSEVSNIGGASLEILYDVNKNCHVDYIVNELKDCRSLGYTVNETVKRLAEELKMIDHMLAVYRANLKAGYAKQASWRIITELLKVKYYDRKK